MRDICFRMVEWLINHTKKNIMLYNICSFIWRNTVLRYYRTWKNIQYKKYWREHRLRGGIRKENRDKVFFVVRRRELYCGLMSFYITFLIKIDYAVRNGYVPVVDMASDYNIYIDKAYGKNAWEYFFQQPGGYTLEDIKRSKNVIWGSGYVNDMHSFFDVDFLTGKNKELEYWRKVAKKYIIINEKTQNIVREKYEELFDKTDRVLGVLARGTDYLARPGGHPVQPNVEDIVAKAKEVMEVCNCNKLFLATEDKRIFDRFMMEFGQKLIYSQSNQVNYRGRTIGKSDETKQMRGYAGGIEYLVSMILLSKCHCFIAGRTSGTAAVAIMSEGFEYQYFWDLGVY